MKQDRCRVLVVESDPAVWAILSRRLNDAVDTELEVCCVTSCADALDELEDDAFDMMLVGLNRGSVAAQTETIRRTMAMGSVLSLLGVTSAPDDSLVEAGKRAGAEEVFALDDLDTPLFSRAILYARERRRARESSRELELVLATIPDGVLVVAETGEVQYVNETALSLFGRRREDFVGELLGFSFQDGGATDVTVLRKGEPFLCELRVSRIEWRRTPCLLVLGRDVTEQRKMEAQLAVSDRMTTIGGLAAGVAHEINNPLAAVIANLDLLKEQLARMKTAGVASDVLDEELRDALDASGRIRNIVRDLKMFSRAQDERCSVVDIHRVLESSARMARNEIRHRAKLVTDFTAPLKVLGNESRLGQVFLNLLINAAQAIPPGNANANEIRIATRHDEQGRSVVSISDTGGGIPADVQKRLFSAFFTTKAPGEGTGLGLTISQRIVTSLGGQISFESQVGAGTTFQVVLPSAGAETSPTTHRAVAEVAPGRRGRILVIDDDHTVGRSVQRALTGDHAVTVVADASLALLLMHGRHPFDVVLCDVMMPQKTGVEFFQEVRAMDQSLAQRVVFMTGGVLGAEARAFLDDVGNPCLEKPFDVQALRTVVREYVG